MLVVRVRLRTVDLQHAKRGAGLGLDDNVDRRNDMMVCVERRRHITIGLL